MLGMIVLVSWNFLFNDHADTDTAVAASSTVSSLRQFPDTVAEKAREPVSIQRFHTESGETVRESLSLVTVRGVVTDAVSNRPLAGAKLRLASRTVDVSSRAKLGSFEAKGYSREDGSFEILVGKGGWVLRASALGFGALDRVVEVDPDRTSQPIGIALESESKLRVRVVDDRGVAQSGHGVAVRSRRIGESEDGLEPAFLGETGEDGWCGIDGLAQGTYGVRAFDERVQIDVQREVTLTVSEVETLEIRVPARASLIVELNSDDGSRIAGATVWMHDGVRGDSRRAISDERGLVHFQRIAAGHVHVRAWKSGYSRIETTAEIADEPGTVTVPMVLGASGTPTIRSANH